MELLIVDDEKSAVNAVKQNINWDRLPFEKVEAAYCMEDAIEIIRQNQIGVLLCDIEMPKGNGLQLVEWINENKPGICCIFMTCYADFNYAQQAVRLGSTDYILKPLDFERVEEALQRAAEKYQNTVELENAENNWKAAAKVVEKQFWKELFAGTIGADKNEVEEYLKRNHLNISSDNLFLPVLFRINREDGRDNFPVNVKGSQIRRMSHILLETFSEKYVVQAVEWMTEERILIVLYLHGDENKEKLLGEVEHCCRKAISGIEETCKVSLCSYMNGSGRLEEIPDLIEQLYTMDYNNIMRKYTPFIAGNKKNIYLGVYDRESEYFIVDTCTKHPEGILKALEVVKKSILENRNKVEFNSAYVEWIFRSFYYVLLDFAEKNNVLITELIDTEVNARLMANVEKSYAELMEWIEYIYKVLKKYLQDTRVSLTDIIKDYIDSHIEEVTVEQAANYVGLNADYLNRVFKKDTGVPLNKYIINCKIERAKWLLLHTEWQVGEIAMSVGYYAYSSFYRAFTRKEGISPQEWKEQKKGQKV